MAITFSLEIAVQPDHDSNSADVLIATMNSMADEGLASSTEPLHLPSIPIVHCDSFRLFPAFTSLDDDNGDVPHPWAAVFCPSTLVQSAIDQLQVRTDETRHTGMIEWLGEPFKASQTVLSLLHPFIAHNYTIRAILTNVDTPDHRPGDIVVIDLRHSPRASIFDLLDSTNGQVIYSGPEAILKVLLLDKVEFTSTNRKFLSGASVGDVPTCAVCLHRIDPSCLGLPQPPRHQICSKFCPPPNLSMKSDNVVSCPRQRLLKSWPLPNYCKACQVIRTYWSQDEEGEGLGDEMNNGHLVCFLCGMKKTLWACLTCGFVGCGRYSNKHAAEHNTTTLHPYCLELSTLRIWNYEKGEFAHRVDLLECPSSPPLLHPWVVRGPTPPAFASTGNASTQFPSLLQDRTTKSDAFTAEMQQSDEQNHYSDEHITPFHATYLDEKTPKKATMIGEEYEALLQSALDEQAQHYEGEITSLRAILTAQQIDQDSVTQSEALEIEMVRQQIGLLRNDIDHASRELLDSQAQEAGHRATSQRLLREQGGSQDLLKKIQEEAASEYDLGRMQVEELELQIDDLTVNHRMMRQFSQSNDLKNSQIVGTEHAPQPKSKKGGKKTRKLFRK